MAYTTHQGNVSTNSEESEIKEWTDSTLTLVNEENKQLRLIFNARRVLNQHMR